MSGNQPLLYLAGYPERLVAPVRALLAEQRLGAWLLRKYPLAHGVRTDRSLYNYVDRLKSDCLRHAGPLSKVVYDGKLQHVQQALGTHARIASVQGGRLKTRREIRIASVFREAPAEFLSMIVAHELAHLKESGHDKPFYQLCCHIEPDYHQLEFEVRAYLCYLSAGGEPLWQSREVTE
jgi:predicted metal-dependent hydrolase